MRLFVSSLSSKGEAPTPPPSGVPIGISYVSQFTVYGNGGLTGHQQGFEMDLDNDIVYISWTEGVNGYSLSTGDLLYTTPPVIGTPIPPSTSLHVGDIALKDGLIYSAVNLMSGEAVTPITQMVYVWNADLTFNRQVTSDYDYLMDGIASNKYSGELWGGYASQLLTHGELQQVNTTTLLKDSGFYDVADTGGSNSDFGGGIQTMDYFENPNFIACSNYNNYIGSGSGTNILFWNLSESTYDVIEKVTSPYIFGISINGDKFYRMESVTTAYVDSIIREYDIIYAP